VLRRWIFARILAFPPFFYVQYLQWDQVKLLSTYTKSLFVTFPVILTILNTWWFSKILKGVIKLLSKRPAASKEKKA
jgi:uncharacterized membrane protein